jgi:hypothetical protein
MNSVEAIAAFKTNFARLQGMRRAAHSERLGSVETELNFIK